MKTSLFNSIIPYQGHFIYYNAYSDIFLQVNKELHQIFYSNLVTNTLNELEDIHEDFFNTLVGNKFLIHNEINELNEIQELAQEYRNSNEYFDLTILPTLNCNFNCWYCYENKNEKSKISVNTTELILKFIKRLFANNKNLKHLHIAWFGGEPMLYFNSVIVPILDKITELEHRSNIQIVPSMTTNGYLIKQEHIQRFQKFNFNHFQITLDGGKEAHDKTRFPRTNKGSFEQILHNIRLLCENNLRVTARINYTKENINTLPSLINSFKFFSPSAKKNLSISFHQVWQDTIHDLNEDISKIMRLFKQENFSVPSSIGISSLRHPCYADKVNSAVINHNGDLYKCTARDFTEESNEGKLIGTGELVWNDKLDFNRSKLNFSNFQCPSCRILPLCGGGGCSQAIMENKNKEFCPYNFDDKRIDSAIIKKYQQQIL